MSWYAFTSGDGRVVGVARCKGKTAQPLYGVALAVLEEPCALDAWKDLLIEKVDPYDAASRMTDLYGGVVIFRIVPVLDPGWLLTGTLVGEA